MNAVRFLLPLMVAVARVSAAASLDFNLAPSWPFPYSPSDVAAGDFNGDGKPDLVVGTGTYLSPGIMLVFINKGDGTFAYPVSYPTSQTIYHLVVADFNGDGKLDIAAAEEDGISVFTGNGDGTFRLTANNRTDPRTRWIAAADFNHDGFLDLVTCSSEAKQVTVFWNVRGTGFNAGKFDIGENAWSVATGGFNGDGNPDIVTANWKTNSLSLLFGDGKGGFGLPRKLVVEDPNVPGAYPWLVGTADFNADGMLDLAVPGFGVWLGRGDGTFRWVTSPEGIGAGQDFEIGDINADGRLDIASGPMSLAFGRGDGSFIRGGYGVRGFAQGLAVADINGDGRKDLVTVGDSLEFLFQKSDGTFTAPQRYAMGDDNYRVTFLVADLNENGVPDLVAGESNPAASVRLGNGDGTFGPVSLVELDPSVST